MPTSLANAPMASDTAPTTSPLSANLDNHLASFFVSLNGQTPVGQLPAFKDSDIQEIASILGHLNKPWARVPRTYIVLRAIGHLNLLDTFIELGFTDHWFPVVIDRGIPSSISPSVRTKFKEAQSLVFTRLIDLEKGEHGRHLHFSKGEMPPFEFKGVLGTGSFGQVDRVLSCVSYKEYALKRIHRAKAFGPDSSKAVKQFVVEINTLKRAKHDHIVELVGSYTDSKHLAIIMSPVADMDLATYLKLERVPPSPEKSSTLRTYFGCLANALDFLHSHQIRHKDIKSRNILIKDTKVLLTDFGLARDLSDRDGSTTASACAFTPRYCAPEVALDTARNTKSDIWSLGCVFLEILAVFKGQTTEFVKKYLESNGTMEPYPYQNLAAVTQITQELKTVGEAVDNVPIPWIEIMLRHDQKKRPTAAEIVDWSTAHDPQQDHQFRFCGICCMDIEDSDGSEGNIDDIADYTNQTASEHINSALLPVEPLESSVNNLFNSLSPHDATVQSMPQEWAHTDPGHAQDSQPPYPKDPTLHTKVEALPLAHRYMLGGRTGLAPTRENQQQRIEEEYPKILKNGRTLLHSSESKVSMAAFSPDGDLVAIDLNRKVGLWDSVTGAFYSVCEIPRSGFYVQKISPDTKLTACFSGDRKNKLTLWDTLTASPCGVFENDKSLTSPVEFSPDGRLLACVTHDKTVKLWDTATGEPRITLRQLGQITSIAFSPDSKLVATVYYHGTITLWDSETGATRARLEGHSGYVTQISFSPDGKLLASASKDEKIKLWDTTTGELCTVLNGHQGKVVHVVFAPNGKSIASASDDNTAMLWDAATGALDLTLRHSDKVFDVKFSPDGNLLASTSWEHIVRLWDPTTGILRNILDGHSSIIRFVLFSPDSKLVATGYDTTIKIWASGTGDPVAEEDNLDFS